jgi:hypothetical protein
MTKQVQFLPSAKLDKNQEEVTKHRTGILESMTTRRVLWVFLALVVAGMIVAFAFMYAALRRTKTTQLRGITGSIGRRRQGRVSAWIKTTWEAVGNALGGVQKADIDALPE